MSRPRYQPYESKKLDPCSAFCIIHNYLTLPYYPRSTFTFTLIVFIIIIVRFARLELFYFPSHPSPVSFSSSSFSFFPTFQFFSPPSSFSVGNESRQSIHFPLSSRIVTFFFQVFILYKTLDLFISTIRETCTPPIRLSYFTSHGLLYSDLITQRMYFNLI